MKDFFYLGLVYWFFFLFVDKSFWLVFRGKECFKVFGKVIFIIFFISVLGFCLLSCMYMRRFKVLFEDFCKGVFIRDIFLFNIIFSDKLYRRMVKNLLLFKFREEDGNELVMFFECYLVLVLFRFVL